MFRIAFAAALSATLLSLGVVNAAAAPVSPPGYTSVKLTCLTDGRTVTLRNDSGIKIPKGSKLIFYFVAAGKFKSKDVVTLRSDIPVGFEEPQSYTGNGPITSCIIVARALLPYATKINPNAASR
jgi:hypothetical protein